MELEQAFAPSVTIAEFFEEVVPALHRERLDDFRQFTDVALIVCLKLLDTGDVFSVELGLDGCTVEDDEMVDFPIVTIKGWDKYWQEVKRHSLELLQELDRRQEELADSFRVTPAFLDDFGKLDAVIDVTITETEDHPEITFSLVLNDYEPYEDASRFSVEIPLSRLRAVARGEADVVEAARALDIGGDYRFAAYLGGLFLTHAED